MMAMNQMFRMILLLYCVFIMPIIAFADTYYVTNDTGGDNGTYFYRAGAWPAPGNYSGTADTLNSLLALLDSKNNTIVLDAGVYVISEPLNTSGTDTKLRYPIATDPDYTLHSGDIVIDAGGMNEPVFLIDQEGWMIGHSEPTSEKIRLQNSFWYGLKISGVSPLICNLETASCARGLYVNSSPVFKWCKFSNDYQSGEVVAYIDHEASPHYEYCDFYDFSDRIADYGTSKYTNCNIYGSRRRAFTAGGESIFNNTLVYGCGADLGINDSIISFAGGTLNCNNSHVCSCIPNRKENTRFADSASITENNHLNHELCRFISHRYPAIFVISIDDRQCLTDFSTLARYMKQSHGWYASFGCSSASYLTSDDYANLLSIYADGHEICVHGNRCFNKVPDVGGVTVTYTGSAESAEISVYDDNGDLLADRMELLVDSDWQHSDSVVFSLDDFNNLLTLSAAINALQNYSCSVQAADASGGVTRYLETGSHDMMAGAVQIEMDIRAKYYGEIAEPKVILETAGMEIHTFIPPGHALTDGMRDYMRSAGFVGSRGGTWNGTDGSATGEYLIEAAKPYDIMVYSACNLFDSSPTVTPSESQVKERIGDLVDLMGTRGGVCSLYGHGFDEFSFLGWQRVLKILHDAGATVLTLGEAVKFLRTYDPSGDIAFYESDKSTPAATAADAMYITRTMVDRSDYTLKTDSAMRNAGMTVADVHEQSIPIAGMNGFFEHFFDDGVDVGSCPANDQRKYVTATTYVPTGFNVRGTAASPALVVFENPVVSIDTSGLILNEPLHFVSGEGASSVSVNLQSNHKLFDHDGCTPVVEAVEYHRAESSIWSGQLADISQIQKQEQNLYVTDIDNDFAVTCRMNNIGAIEGSLVDWWVVLISPDGEMWSFSWPMGWIRGLVPVFSGSVASFDVFGIYWSDAWTGGQTGVTQWGLPDKNMAMQPGNWWFAFGVDDLPDGKLNGNVWYDDVTVSIPY